MIISTYFSGDNDEQTQLLQHDVYHDALRIIVRNCEGQARLAHMVLYDDWGERWNPSRGYDHRTLQTAHDFLAATWRFRHASWIGQYRLPLDSLWDEEPPDFAAHWLEWLENEVKSWNEISSWFSGSDDRNARLIRLVVRILENQNIPVGYRAEKKLAWELINRFDDVPWERRLADSVRSAYDALED